MINVSSSDGGNTINIHSSASKNIVNTSNNMSKYYSDLALMYAVGLPTEPKEGSAKYWATSVKQNRQVDWNQTDSTKNDYINNKPLIPTKISDLTNDSDFVTSSYHDSTKQNTLVSGTTIKTVNNNSILGSGNLELDFLPSQVGQCGKYLTTDGSTVSWAKVQSGLPIGTIFSVACSSSYIPTGALSCDGTEYAKIQFNDFYTNYLVAGLLNTCTYTEYNAEVTTYGQCGKFAIDSVNEKFKVPTIKNGSYITQALSDSELGKSYKESLPNITGSFANLAMQDSAATVLGDGCFSGIAKGGGGYGTFTSSVAFDGYDLNASLSSSTYQDNAKVQGDNVRMRYFVQVANGTINESQMDWSSWASGLETKLNADHTNDAKPYIVEVSDKSLMPSWYRVYSDGWCEQGGRTSSGVSAPQKVAFLKAFKDVNYTSFAGIGGIGNANNNNYPITTLLKTTTDLTICNYSSSTGTNNYYEWQASGYIE